MFSKLKLGRENKISMRRPGKSAGTICIARSLIWEPENATSTLLIGPAGTKACTKAVRPSCLVHALKATYKTLIKESRSSISFRFGLMSGLFGNLDNPSVSYNF